MTLVIMCGLLCGLGCIGVVHALRPVPPSLEHLLRTATKPASQMGSRRRPETLVGRLVGPAVEWAEHSGGMAKSRTWARFETVLRLSGQSLDRLAYELVIVVSAGLFLPPVMWLLMRAGGVRLPIVVTLVGTLVLLPLGACVPLLVIRSEAIRRRRHFRSVIGSFIDLVVLGLAGGMGVEGALHAAAGVSSDWASVRIARALSRARDAGESPWTALGRLGDEVGVPEMTELAATIGLAGTEGARVRQSLAARATALRRHEQADAESAANATTERLFLPGVLLLVGFLVFIGYPAFSRIVTGL